MSLTFRDAAAFWTETLAVTGGALAAGVAVGAVGPTTLGVSLVAAAGGAALWGGSIGAAVTRQRLGGALVRTAVGLLGGGIVAAAFAALAQTVGSGELGMALAGGLGGLALGGLLGTEERVRAASRAAGLVGAGTAGAVGAVALGRIAEFAISESAPIGMTSATMAGVLGLWIAAAAGLRRLEPVRDPLGEKAEDVLEGLAEPARSKTMDALQAWTDVEDGLGRDANMTPETAAEARKQARLLVESALETATTWKQIHADLSSPRLRGIEEKLVDLEKRAAETTDAVTAGHLQRAVQALRAQKVAIDGLRVGCSRAEAALDAQVALLERLRLAVAQHRISDRERFAVEVSAVADQVSRLSDDLESLSAAIAEAEALSDRKLLAELERAGRRALSQLEEGGPAANAPAPTVDAEESPVSAEIQAKR